MILLDCVGLKWRPDLIPHPTTGTSSSQDLTFPEQQEEKRFWNELLNNHRCVTYRCPHTFRHVVHVLPQYVWCDLNLEYQGEHLVLKKVTPVICASGVWCPLVSHTKRCVKHLNFLSHIWNRKKKKNSLQISSADWIFSVAKVEA